MKRMLMVWACAAAVSAAQGASWEMEIKPGYIVNVGDYVTISIFAVLDESDYAFAAGEFRIFSEYDPFGYFYDVDEHLGGPGSSAGVIEGNVVTGIVTGQLHDPGAGLFADTSNPILVWTGRYTTTDFSFHQITIATETSVFDVYTDELGGRASRLDGFEEGFGEVLVCACPTPGAGGLMVAGGVWSMRRRRA